MDRSGRALGQAAPQCRDEGGNREAVAVAARA